MIITNPILTCLWCNINAVEKAQYYCSIFPNSKIISNVAIGLGFVYFELNGASFQTLNGGVDFEYNNSISLTICCKDQQEVDYYWSSFLNTGGKAIQCGWLQDKYGTKWQVIPNRLMELITDKDKQKAQKVFDAMVNMVKIDIAILEKSIAN